MQLSEREGQAGQILSGEELDELGDIGPAELVGGELIPMAPTGYLHGIVEAKLAHLLGDFVRTHQLGEVMTGEVGIYTRREPDTVRAADLIFISHQRLATVNSQNFLDVAPELVGEVLSPGDRWSQVAEKLDEYFEIGVTSVWIADPRRKQVFVYHAPTQARRFTCEETLSDEKALPGFSVRVNAIF